MAVVGEDCYYYFYSVCAKGEKCPFRHSPAARGKEVMCKRWLAGSCAVPGCAFRHMMLQKDRTQIACWFENQPSGCLKAHCPFKHSKPRPALSNNIPPVNSEASSTIENVQPQLPVDHALEAHCESATVTEIVDKREMKTTGEASQAVTVVLPNDGELMDKQQDILEDGRGEQAQCAQSPSLEVRKRARLDRFKGQAPVTTMNKYEKQTAVNGQYEPAAKRQFVAGDRLPSLTASRSSRGKRPVISNELAPAAKRQYGVADSSVGSEPARRVLDTDANGQGSDQKEPTDVVVRSFKEIMAEKQAMKEKVGSGAAGQKQGSESSGEAETRARLQKRFERRHAELASAAIKQKHVQALAKEKLSQSEMSPSATGVVRVLSFQEIMMQKRKNSASTVTKDEPKSVQPAVDRSITSVSAADSSSSVVQKSSMTSVSSTDRDERTPQSVSTKNGLEKLSQATNSARTVLRKSNSELSSKSLVQELTRSGFHRLSRESLKLASQPELTQKESALVLNKATSQSMLSKKSESKTAGPDKETPLKPTITKDSGLADTISSPSLNQLEDVEMDDDEFMQTLKDFDVKGDLLDDDDLLLDVEEVL